MPPRTPTTHLSTFTRPTATISFSSPPGSSPITTLTLPPHSPWTSGLHWHETHTEFLSVVAGVAWLSLGGETRLLRPSDGEVVVKPFARHEWQRPTAGELRGEEDAQGVIGEDLVVREWTEPGDGQKEVFFRNLNSLLLERGPGGWWAETEMGWRMWVIFYEMDNFPVIWGRGTVVQGWVTHVLLWGASVVGRVVGVRGWYEEYTPWELRRKMK